MSTVVWFGKYKGHELRCLYAGRQRRWGWLLQNCDKWRSDLEEIERRYHVWRANHPRANTTRVREQGVILNPKGEKLGLADDGVASDNNDSYDSDGGWVVRSDEELAEESNEQYEDGDTDMDNLEDINDSGIADHRVVGTGGPVGLFELPGHSRSDREGSSDSSLSLPSVNEMLRSTPGRTFSRSEGRSIPKTRSQARNFPQSTINMSEDADSGPEMAAALSTQAAKLTPVVRRVNRVTQRQQAISPRKHLNCLPSENDSDHANAQPATKRRKAATPPRSPELTDACTDEDEPVENPKVFRRQPLRNLRKIVEDTSDEDSDCDAPGSPKIHTPEVS